MLKKIRHHRYFPHIFWAGIVVFVLLFVLMFAQKAHSVIKIIDTHEHIQSVKKADELVLAMKNLDIDKIVLIPSPIETLTLNGNQTFTRYQENNDELLKIAEKYPNDFMPFCTVSPADSNALEILKDCHERGGKGLKLYNGHSFFYDSFNTKLDSTRMKPIYAYAERNKLPVLYHVNITNYGDELENVLKEFPDLVVSVPHFMVSSIKIEKVMDMLDKYPNLYTDISFGHTPYFAAGFRRISNDPQKYINFFKTYPDRVLFGTDMVLTEIEKKDQQYMETVLECYMDILEKDIFTCKPVNDYYKEEAEKNQEAYTNCEPKTGDFCDSKKEKMDSFTKWYNETKVLHGLNLSSDILKRVYQENAERFLYDGGDDGGDNS